MDPARPSESVSRSTFEDLRGFVGIARGSAGEARSYLLLAMELEYLPRVDGDRLRGEYARVIQMLTKLARSLEGKRRKAPWAWRRDALPINSVFPIPITLTNAITAS